MTEQQLCNLVLEASGKSEKELPKFRILALANLALQRIATIVAIAKDDVNAQALRQLVRSPVDVTITAGVGDLSAAKSDTEPILAEQIATSDVYFSGITRKGQYVPDRAALAWDHPAGFPFFTVSGDTIAVRYNGSSPSCTATITGPVVKTLANLPQTLNENFAALVAFMDTPQGMVMMGALANTSKEVN